MVSLIFFLLFFLGASVASFLQMYLDTGGGNLWRGLGDGSKCDGCKKSLSWINLVPVLSWIIIFIINSGKTKCCGQNLSWKYIFGEIILGLWFVGCVLWFGFENVFYLDFGFIQIQFILSVILGCIFFMLVMQDLEDMSVSSRYLYLLCAVSIIGMLVALATPLNGFDTTAGSAGDVALVALWPLVIFSPFWLIYFLGKVINKPMIGEADPYVFTSLGIFFGTQFSISLFLYSVWVGSVWGIGYLYFVNKKFERNVRIPFVPIIFIACLIILITNYHVINIRDILLVNALF